MLKIFKESFLLWWASSPFSSGAAAAFYAVFSLPSAIVIVLTFAGLIVDPAVVERVIIREIQDLAGIHGSLFVESIVGSLRQGGHSSAGILSVLGIIIGSLGLFTQLQSTLDRMWKVPEHHTEGIMAWLYHNIIALFVILLFGGLIMVSVLAGFFWSLFSHRLLQVIPVSSVFLSAANILQSVVIVGVAFGTLYGYLPTAKVSFRSVLAGSAVATVLFAVGRELIAWYLSLSTSISAYGAASALVIILLWIYYSSQIFFFGAAVARVVDRALEISAISPTNANDPTEKTG